jgi:hypothetical protein
VVLKKAELIAFLFAHVEGRDLARFQPTDSVEGILETHAILARHLVRDSRHGSQARDLTEDLEKETLVKGQFLILICKAAKALSRDGPQVESRVCWRDLSRHESR